LQEENLYYAKKEDQQELLQKVLAANDTAADDEETQQNAIKSSSSTSQMFRSQGTLSSLSGGDEGLYMEIRRQKESSKVHHPLFKKFYYKK
jgi:hypothetical protein